ncbi:unnamed protein product [Closterium sp. NIES-53]
MSEQGEASQGQGRQRRRPSEPCQSAEQSTNPVGGCGHKAGRGGHLSERDRCREGGRHRAAADGVLTPAPKPAAVAAAAVAAAAVAAARGGAAAAYKHPIKLTIDLIETIFNANAESSSTAEETATISATGSQKRGKGGKKGGKGGGGGGGASGGGPRTAGPAGGGTGPGGVAVAPQQQQQPQQ